MSKLNFKSVSILGLTGLLALAFIAAGVSKLMGVEQTVLPFERMGMPLMAKIVGLLEIAGAVGLFIPQFRFLAALGLSATMVGAAGYHLTLDPEMAVIPALVLLVLTGALTWVRRPSLA